MSDLFETVATETILIVRAQVCARFFIQFDSHALAERIVGANKMCPAAGARFIYTHLVSFTTMVLKPFTSMSAR